MSIDQRLSRLAPNLTAQERAILILEAWKEGRQEAPSWRQSMPQEQTESFNHYIELMNRTNNALGRVISLLLQHAEKIEIREGWLLSLALWQGHLDNIRQAIHREVRSPVTRTRLDAVLTWTPTVDDLTLPETPAGLQNSLKELIAHKLVFTWVELHCVDAVVAEIADAFNGADPLRPVFRDKMDTTRQKLVTIKEELLELHGMDVVLRDPLEEELQYRRDWFDSLPAES